MSKKPEVVYMKPAAGPCETHEWPTEGMAARLIDMMRERHGKGGLNVCVDCLTRAKEALKAKIEARGCSGCGARSGEDHHSHCVGSFD